MRKLTITLIAIAACLTVFTNVQAQAGVSVEPICFPFEDLGCDNGNVDAIGEYMTGIYGPTVTVENAKITDNFTIFGHPVPWLGKPDGDYYMKTDGSKYLEINFEKPITNVSGDGRVFLGLGGPDFRVEGLYDSNLINSFEDDVCLFGNVPFDIAFDSPVNQLRIGSDSCFAVALDNLCVTPVPVPGAGVLSMLGMGIAGWLKRRNTL
jgi:hypothetical protein